MSSNNSLETKSKQPSKWQLRLAAVGEVCGVYMVGQLLAFLLIRLLGLQVTNPIETLKANPNADLLEMSWNLGVLLLCQYGGILLPAFAIGWWYRKRRFSGYGLTSGQPLFQIAEKNIFNQILTGIVLFSVAELPLRFLSVMDRFIPLGVKAVTQEIAYMLDWGDYRFWVFMAVGGFLLIPIVEELFYRGYVQTRLAEDFDAPTAIFATALFFTFSHSQYYLTLSPWTIGVMLNNLWGSLAWGYVFYRTRSLLPVIIAHAIVNFPVRGMADFILPAAMLLIIVIYRRQLAEVFRSFSNMIKSNILSKVWTATICIFFTLFAIMVALAEDVALLFGILAFVIALVLEFTDRRKSTTQNIQKETSLA